MEAHQYLTLRRSDIVGASAIVLITLAIGEASIFGGLRLSRGMGFLLGDEGHSLFVASRLLQHARLYRDVAYVYGWLPVSAYIPVARAFGNTPVVYLEFLLSWSLIALLIGYAVVRQRHSALAASVVVVAGLVPVFVIPGSLLGGYVSTFYIPMERAALLSAVLIWRLPHQRTVARSAALGSIAVLMQMLKFGPGLVLLAAITTLDMAVLLAEQRPHALSEWLRATMAMAAAFVVGEGIFAGAVFRTLPFDVAADVLWPSYLREAYPAWASRWPGWNGWRLLVAQYANPIAGATLSVVSAVPVLRRSRPADRGLARFLLLPLLFLFGMFSFFRTVDHFRQFAWMLTIGAVPALGRSRVARIAAIAAWLPVFGVVATSVVRGRASNSVDLVTPAGWRLRVAPAEAARADGIRGALDALTKVDGAAPVIFYPSGSGFYVAYEFEPPGRTVWFFSHAVRPYEIPDLQVDFRRAGSVVTCGPGPLFEMLPASLRGALVSRLDGPLWTDGGCALFRLRRGAL